MRMLCWRCSYNPLHPIDIKDSQECLCSYHTDIIYSFSSEGDNRYTVSYLLCRSRRTFPYQWRSSIYTMQHKNPESSKRCFHCISDDHFDVKPALMNTWQLKLLKEWFHLTWMHSSTVCWTIFFLNSHPENRVTLNQGFTTLASLGATSESCHCSQGDAGFQDKLRGICISRERPSGSQCLLCNQGAVLPTNIIKACTQNISFAANTFTFSS